MKFNLLLVSTLILNACGGVTEKGAELSMLPEGETNAATSESSTTTTTETTTEETETDTTLTGIAAILQDVESKRTTTCTNAAQCSFTTPWAVKSAIVFATVPCSVAPGCRLSSTGSVGTTYTAVGTKWAMVQELETGASIILYLYGDYSGITTTLKVGDKVDFTATKYTFFSYQGQVSALDPAAFTVSTPTLADNIKFAAKELDLGAINFDTPTVEPAFRMMSGSFKVAGSPVQIGSSSQSTIDLNTKTYTGTHLKLKLLTSAASTYTIGSCFTYEHFAPSKFRASATAVADYQIDLINYDFKTYGISAGPVKQTDCATVGL